MSEPSPLYRDAAIMRMREQLDSSHAFLGLATERWLDDPLCWAQLGYAVMKDKPIYLLVRAGTPIPANLQKCAVAMEVFVSEEDLELAMARLLARMR